MTSKNIFLGKLPAFLSEANKETYANAKAEKAASTRLKSSNYHYEKDGLVYHDTYFGGAKFMGEEIVYQDGSPMWGMNYYGFMTVEDVAEKEMAVFLRKALMQDSGDAIPVRGPKSFSEGEWTYKLSVQGSLIQFTGEEQILKGGRIIYKLYLHGGFIE